MTIYSHTPQGESVVSKLAGGGLTREGLLARFTRRRSRETKIARALLVAVLTLGSGLRTQDSGLMPPPPENA